MMIHIGQASMVSVLNRCESMPYEKFCEEMLSYGMDPSFLVHSYVKGIISSEYQFKSNFRKVLHPLYDLYPDAFEKAWEQGDINTKLCTASYLVQKNSKKHGELKKWMESVIKNSLEALFENCGISNNQLESMKKYLEGGLFVSDKIIDEVKNQVQPNTLHSYILSILCGFCYLIIQESKLAKRFLRLMIGVQYQEAYQKLYDFVTGTERLTLFETLHQELDIPREWEIAWMGRQSAQNKHDFTHELRAAFQKDQKIFEKAIEILQGREKIYLYRFFWKQGKGKQYISSAEEICTAESIQMLHALGYHSEFTKQVAAYLEGYKTFEEILPLLQENKNHKIGYFYYGFYMQTVFWIHGASPLVSRIMQLYAYLGNHDLLNGALRQYEDTFQVRNKIDMFLEFLRSIGVGLDVLMHFAAESAATGYDTVSQKTAEKWVEKYTQEVPEEAKQCIAACSAEARALLLEKLFAADPKQHIYTIIEYFGDTAKVVKEKIIKILTGMPEFSPQVEPMLVAKKQGQREIAVSILVAWEDEHSIEALRKVLDVEKNEKIKNLIIEALDVDQKVERDDSQFDVTAYCKAAVKGNQKSVIQWLQIDTLPKIRLKKHGSASRSYRTRVYADLVWSWKRSRSESRR